jgi:hypothetical protein
MYSLIYLYMTVKMLKGCNTWSLVACPSDFRCRTGEQPRRERPNRMRDTHTEKEMKESDRENAFC